MSPDLKSAAIKQFLGAMLPYNSGSGIELEHPNQSALYLLGGQDRHVGDPDCGD